MSTFQAIVLSEMTSKPICPDAQTVGVNHLGNGETEFVGINHLGNGETEVTILELIWHEIKCV